MSDVLPPILERATCINQSTRCLSYELEQQLTDSATTLFEDETRFLFNIRWTGDGSKHPANQGIHPRERKRRYLGADNKYLHCHPEIHAHVNREGHARIPTNRPKLDIYCPPIPRPDAPILVFSYSCSGLYFGRRVLTPRHRLGSSAARGFIAVIPNYHRLSGTPVQLRAAGMRCKGL